MNQIEKLMEIFGSRNKAEYKPTDELPGGLVGTVATWEAATEWQDHPQVKAWRRRGRFAGWDSRRNKLWTGEG